jgi:hypothetical protein
MDPLGTGDRAHFAKQCAAVLDVCNTFAVNCEIQLTISKVYQSAVHAVEFYAVTYLP